MVEDTKDRRRRRGSVDVPRHLPHASEWAEDTDSTTLDAPSSDDTSTVVHHEYPWQLEQLVRSA